MAETKLEPKKTIASYFPFYYGWVIVGVTLTTMLVAYGTWWSFPVFYVNILNQFGWTRAATAFIFTLGAIVYGLSSVPVGALVDRLGPRRVFPAACLIVSAGCLISSQATEKWHFYVAYGVFMGFGTICMGFVPSTAVLSNWFVRKRGLAMGISLVGNVAPPLLAFPIQKVISHVGWQRTYLVLALVLMTVVAPSAALLLRTRPRDLGLEPDGVPAPGENCAIEMNSRIGLSLSEGLRTRQFWAMAGVMLTIAVGIGITMQHVIAMAVDMGHAREFGALIFSIAGILAAAGRLSGFVSDRLGREAAFTIVGILFLASVFALLGFLATKEAWTLYLYAVTFGLGSGLSSPTIGAGAADLFGGRSFGKILGFANISYGVGIGVGAWAGGMIFDRMGSYRLAVLAAIPLFILMSALFWVMAPGKAKKR